MNNKKASIFFLALSFFVFTYLNIFIDQHRDYFAKESWTGMVVDKGSLKDAGGSSKYVLTLVNEKYDRIEHVVGRDEYNRSVVGHNYSFTTSGYIRNDKPWMMALIFALGGLATFYLLVGVVFWLKRNKKPLR